MNDAEIREFLAIKENVAPLLPDHISLANLLIPGGQGMVYRGTVDRIDAAIKIYYPGQVETRVDREIEDLIKLDNPHIVKLLWSGHTQIDDCLLPAVATTFINGTNLNVRINGQGMPPNEISLIIYTITDAIAAMWEYRIVHRDLKPANILIMPDGQACVIDLGVARHIDRTSLTATGYTWGTRGYMSPEQAKAAKQLTCKSDIFALGVIAVECALGRHPTRNDQERLISMKLHENLPPQISSWELAPLIADMLQPHPTRRPSPEEILTALAMTMSGG